MANEERIRKAMLPLRVLSAGLMAACLVYVGIGYVVSSSGAGQPLEPVMVYVIGAVALGCLGAIPFLRRVLMPPMSDTSPGMDAAPDLADKAVAQVMAGTIISLAMAEAVAIFGLVLTFISHDVRYVAGFAAVGLAVMAFFFPRESLLESALNAAVGEVR